MMNGKLWMYLLALVMLLGNGAAAQRENKPEGRHGKPEFRKELMAYQRQNIAPFLLEQRKQLDKKLSKADRKELADLRQQLAQHRQDQMEYYRQLKAERKARQTPLTQDQKAVLKEARAKHRAQMERLGELATRNQKYLAPIGEKVKAQQAQWKTDLQAIAAKHGVSQEESKGRHRRKAFMQRKHFQHWNALRFLLMDPRQPSTFFQHPPKESNKAIQVENPATLQLSPNPVTDRASLQFTVAKAGNVRIELLDQQGQVVQLVKVGKLPAGKQEQVVHLNDIKSGVYFYRVTTDSGTETTRFLKH